jgi:hypothetical protein
MDVFLKAIETSQANQCDNNKETTSKMTLVDNKSDSYNPILVFDQRPPQSCLVDNWFTMSVYCYNNAIKELQAVAYDNEGEIFPFIQPETSKDSEPNLAIAYVDNNNKATFKIKFVCESKKPWLHIGIHSRQESGISEKCLLKSPPIKLYSTLQRPLDDKRGSSEYFHIHQWPSKTRY